MPDLLHQPASVFQAYMIYVRCQTVQHVAIDNVAQPACRLHELAFRLNKGCTAADSCP